ncbi:hypothetical protein PMAYCL1PPCAC_04324, partial [Pristionchus mayeri]
NLRWRYSISQSCIDAIERTATLSLFFAISRIPFVRLFEKGLRRAKTVSLTMLATLSLIAVLLNTATGEKFFDPTHGDFKKCGFARTSLLCDPDGVLAKADRIHLDNELKVMEPRTSLRKRGEKKGNCSLAGITPAIYVVRNGEEEKIEEITSFMKDAWRLDEECGNDLMIVLSANETQYHVYRNPNATHQTKLGPYDVAHYINREADTLVNKKIFVALNNILTRTLARATAKYPVWTRTTFPNPMRGEHAKCGLKEAGPLCDPDGIFDEEERQVILSNIAIFEEQTKNSPVSVSHNSSAFCRDRGYSMGLAVMRNVEGGNQKKLTDLAHYMLNTWKLDAQCAKHFIMAISIDDGFFAVTSPLDSRLRMDKFTKYFEDNGSLFVRAEARLALRGIFSSAVEDAHSGALFSLFNRKKRAVSRML